MENIIQAEAYRKLSDMNKFDEVKLVRATCCPFYPSPERSKENGFQIYFQGGKAYE